MNHDKYDDAYISKILGTTQTVAIVGASSNNARPSYFVTSYLIIKGYEVFPINPGQAGNTLLERPVYASLEDVPKAIDLVDIFRAPAAVPPIVDKILELPNKPKVVWMQLGVRNDEAAQRLEAAGIQVVMNRCPKIEYGRLSGEIGWNGVNSGVISSRRQIAGNRVQGLGIRFK